jgi:4-amino-4-deoxy-L-arabinose transferase-like glycosyltransferase
MSIPLNRRLTILFLLAFILRLPGFFWGFDFHDFGSFSFLHLDEKLLCDHFVRFLQEGAVARKNYVYGFPTLSLWLLKFVSLFVDQMTPLVILLTIRFMNIVFGSLTVLLTYKIGLQWGLKEKTAWLAGAFLAFFPLHISESHLATPGVSGVFFVYLTFFFSSAFQKKGMQKHWVAACIAAGAGIAVKFHLELLLPLAALIAFQKSKRWTLLASGLAVVSLSFLVLNIQFFTGELKAYGLTATWEDNFFRTEHRLFWNPLVYGLALFPAVTLPGLGLAGWGFFTRIRRLSFRRWTLQQRQIFFLIVVPILSYSGAVLLLSSNFVRHLLIFLPLVAILAALGWENLFQGLRKKTRTWAYATIFLYLAIGAVNLEKRYVFDPNLDARNWLKKMTLGSLWFGSVLPEESAKTIPPARIGRQLRESEYLVLAHSYNYRFLRSPLTPWTSRPTPAESYHWKSVKDPYFIQDTLLGKTDFKMVQRFEIQEWLPEFFFFKKLLGSFTLEIGDVLIYRRTK